MPNLLDGLKAAVRGDSHRLLGSAVRVAHGTVVSAQLVVVGAVDSVRCRGQEEPEWLADKLTIAAKTFLRPTTARRLVTSARRVFSGSIVIADDSPVPMAPPDSGTEVVPLPFNSGVAIGRNAALARVHTPYTLITDDDVVFTKATRIAQAVDYLEANPRVDGVCAMLIELPRWYTKDVRDYPLFKGAKPALLPVGSSVGGLPVILMGPQIFVGRTESLRSVPYDENIRMTEHRDFFSMASGRLVFVQDPAMGVFHARTPFNREYARFRRDTEADAAYLGTKWG
jgi:hypothetical protein